MQNAGLDEAQAGIKTAGRNKLSLQSHKLGNSIHRKKNHSFYEQIFALFFSVSFKAKDSLWTQNKNVFSSVQSLSCIQLFAIQWTAAHQASLSITNSRSLPKLVSIESVMSSNHLILCHPFLFCLQSFPASGSFQMSQLFPSVAKGLKFQLQHSSFQWIFSTDFI